MRSRRRLGLAAAVVAFSCTACGAGHAGDAGIAVAGVLAATTSHADAAVVPLPSTASTHPDAVTTGTTSASAASTPTRHADAATTPAAADTTVATTAPASDLAPSATATPTVTTTVTTAATTGSTATATPVNPPPVAVERSGADVDSIADVGDPVGIRIPTLEVDSPIVATGVHEDGTVAVPPSADVAGWFDLGPRPGERGPAVVMAHVDSAHTGPGVFYRLREIQAGAVVTIVTTTGPVDFVVRRVEQHAKVEFPTDDVYGPVPGAELRLVTCGGGFDRSVRSYDDNIIVYLVRVTP